MLGVTVMLGDAKLASSLAAYVNQTNTTLEANPELRNAVVSGDREHLEHCGVPADRVDQLIAVVTTTLELTAAVTAAQLATIDQAIAPQQEQALAM